jgi:hypothetical protein
LRESRRAAQVENIARRAGKKLRRQATFSQLDIAHSFELCTNSAMVLS